MGHQGSLSDPHKKLARECLHRDAPHVHSVAGNNDSNSVNQTGVCCSDVPRVNEVREAPDVRNALREEVVPAFQHCDSN